MKRFGEFLGSIKKRLYKLQLLSLFKRERIQDRDTVGKKILSFLKHIIVLLLIFLAILYILAFFFAERIQSALYFPGAYVNTLERKTGVVQDLPTDWEKIYFDVEGKEVFGIYVDNNAEETIYFFHGNGGDLRYFQEAIQVYLDWGYNVLALEYPGYADLDGFPNPENVLLAAELLYQEAQKKYDIQYSDTIIWGYSIGTGVAGSFVKNSDFPVLVLESPYTSWYDLARDKTGFIPQKILGIENTFNTEKNLESYSGAVLIVHGEKDKVVPVLHSYRLQKLQKENIAIVIDEQGDHYNLLDNPNTLSKIKYFFQNKEFDSKQYENQKRIASLDIISDSSLTKYIDPNVAFSEAGYVPKDMRELSDEFIIDSKGDAQMREESAGYFEALAEAFYEEFNEKVVVVSSYRSYSYQAGIKARGCPDNLCAKAGHSEHQSGLSIDLWSASSKQYWDSDTRLQGFYAWLSENAYFYGFHNSYQKGRAIDGYEIEPWHWRYLGVEFADYLYDNEITFAEYYKERMN